MQKLITVAALVLSLNVVAQDLGGFDQDKIEAMAKQAQAAQACMENIDKSELERIKSEADAKTAEVNELCAAGDRAAAQDQAVAFGKALENEPVVEEMKACVGLMETTIPQAAWAQLEDSDTTKVHVCDM